MSYDIEPSNPRESVFVKYWYPFLGFATGCGGCFYRNFMQHKPFFSALHRHAIFGAVGIAAGFGLRSLVDNYLSDRDARVMHYMELHPEDFEVKRRKYKEIFDDWVPIR